ncbi:SDR family NAD(P)-dependent oxidoreductase [Cohnella soli]|uniref:SDR family NAD(P)-dependent oxidoreductase n=1 Tax=Cohnella soli TaxID=425005 RepID=A0ABW0I1L0_9BACL
MQIDLTNRTVLITGATGQLGRVMTRTLASCGANVAIHFNSSAAKAAELRDEIHRYGVRAAIFRADVASFEEIVAMRNQINDELGSVDIVIANAVAQYEWTTILEQSPEDYASQFDTCVMQSVYLAKAFAPNMIERKWGRFVGINTECSMQNFPTQSAYVAGKRGMDGVYRVLAKEIGEHGITVNQVAPGWTISDRDRENHTEVSESYQSNVPLKRRGTDQEIANVVAFLASDLASFITGAYVPVSGGNVMPTI